MHKGVGKRLETRHRYLPHWQKGGSIYFIAWRVAHGVELTMDERLVVLDACRKFHGIRHLIFAAVVMPDHVHLLIQPHEREKGVWWNLSDLLKGMKGASARAINTVRGRIGRLWLDEAFDRIMRPGEFAQKHEYIRLNPFRAGLIDAKQPYPPLWITSYPDGWMPHSMAKPWTGSDRNVRATWIGENVMAKKTDEVKFEDLVALVDGALQQLESGDLPLEQALKRYEEGVAALRRCFEILKQAEKKVQQLSERNGELEAAPFEPEQGEEPPKSKLF